VWLTAERQSYLRQLFSELDVSCVSAPQALEATRLLPRHWTEALIRAYGLSPPLQMVDFVHGCIRQSLALDKNLTIR
jgi:hypothetical protein